MAEREVLREFLYSLGFQVDAGQARKFLTSINSITGAAKLAGQAIASVAVASKAMVASFASQMEKLYYSSQRTKASAGNIQALEFAFSQIGLSAGDAHAALEGMAGAMRMNPGMKGLLDSLVGYDTKGQDTAKSMLDLVRALGKMPHYVGAQYAQMFGMDEKTFLMMVQKEPELRRKMQERAAMNKRAGLDIEAAAAASREYMNTLRQLWETVEVLGQKFSVSLLPYFKQFTDYVRQGMDWLMRLQETSNSMDFGEFGEQLSSIISYIKELDEKFGLVKNTVLVLGTAVKFAFDLIASVAKEALAIFNAVLSVMSGDWAGAKKSLGDMAKFGQQTIDAFKKLIAGEQTPEAAMKLASAWDNKGSGTGPAGSTSVAAPQVAAQAAPSNLPRGMRQNNPGNLRSWGDTATHRGFAAFGSMQEGLSAMAGQLIRYGQRGLTSIEKIISTYAPSSENNTAAYIAAVSKKLGVGASQSLNLQDPATLSRLMGAMIHHEQGYTPFAGTELMAAAQSRLSKPGFGQVAQTNHITVTGVSDPNQAARAVGREINQANANLTRNHAGAVS